VSPQDSASAEWDDLFEIDTSVAHPARLYDYLLGGTVNFQADRAFAETGATAFPAAKTAVRENRRFLHRVLTYLAKERGIRQFLDIGSGIPAADNVHEVAQAIDPKARVVYVDNDPIVLAHARRLLNGTPSGATAYLHADLRDPEGILGHRDLRGTLDLTQPVAVLLISIVHFLQDSDDPHGKVAELTRAFTAGSHLAISHATYDFASTELKAKLSAFNTRERDRFRDSIHPRGKDAVARFFAGMELIEPGIVPVIDWRNTTPPNERPPAADVGIYGAAARIS
jgi:hypothetical protein